MNPSPDRTPRDDDTEFDRLLSQALDGVLDGEEFARLQEQLKANPAARQRFIDQMLLDAELAEEFSAESLGGMVDALSPESRIGSQPVPARRTHSGRVAGRSYVRWAAALLVSAVLGGVVMWAARSREAVPTPRATPPLATITQTRFALSASANQSLRTGQELGAERLAILGGAVEVTLRNGIKILLEGPGELELLGEMKAFLHAGNAVVRLPKNGSSGFRLETATTDVLDLGTEFAVKAGAGLVTDVQVYDGAVMATGKPQNAGSSFPTRLSAGEAARFGPQNSGEPETIAYVDSRFIRRLPPDVGIEHRAHADHSEDLRHFGRPQFDSITVTHAVRPVAIDGRLDDWNAAGTFFSTRDGTADDEERVEGRMMFDDEHLYIAAHVGDPAPLRNVIDPAMDADAAWRGGGVQVRLSTDRAMGWPVHANGPAYYAMRRLEPSAEERAAAHNPRLSHLTMWYHAPSKAACLTITSGMLVSDLVVNPVGFRSAFTRDADGKGYVLEYAIPWRLLNAADEPPRSGDILAAAWQIHWSDESGRLWRDQMVEIWNRREPSRIMVWERAATWGRAEFR